MQHGVGSLWREGGREDRRTGRGWEEGGPTCLKAVFCVLTFRLNCAARGGQSAEFCCSNMASLKHRKYIPCKYFTISY